jgi:hypothetical protein
VQKYTSWKKRSFNFRAHELRAFNKITGGTQAANEAKLWYHYFYQYQIQKVCALAHTFLEVLPNCCYTQGLAGYLNMNVYERIGDLNKALTSGVPIAS